MEELAKKKKKQIWEWIKITFLLAGLICGLLFIYQWWNREQKLERLKAQLAQKEQEIQQQYNLQDLNLISTAELANSPAVHSFFADLLTTYAEKFAKSKKIDISQLPLKFAGFYYEPENGQGLGTMGRCSTETIIYPVSQKEANISLNRLYLLNKFRHDKYFTDNPNQGNYSYLDISFDSMLKTCSHELAHYIQQVKHGKSSCESDLKLNNGEYDKELAKEHEEWTGEIYQLVNGSSEYGEWERKWRETK